MQIYDVIILGGGPSGLTSAIYTSRAKLNTLVLAGNPAGGQLMWTTEVENYPGFIQGIMGPELIENMRKQAERFEATFKDENVKQIKGSVKETFTVITENDVEYIGKTVIIATGASARWLNIESEQRLRGKGVSACATCDGFFFKGKDVAIVGGGDSAMEEALFLTRFANKVYVLVRGSKAEMRASKIMQEEASNNEKIEFVFNTEIKEVLGTESVTGLTLFNNSSNQESNLVIQGLFIAIGHTPNTGFLEGLVDLESNKYLKVTDNTKTSKEGIFAAGDVGDFRYRQAITAAGLGCMAALDVEKYLKSKGYEVRGTSAY
jgi:thioredoxin reductase (NADPH)